MRHILANVRTQDQRRTERRRLVGDDDGLPVYITNSGKVLHREDPWLQGKQIPEGGPLQIFFTPSKRIQHRFIHICILPSVKMEGEDDGQALPFLKDLPIKANQVLTVETREEDGIQAHFSNIAASKLR